MGAPTSANGSLFARASYVREHTARGLLGNTFLVYWRNWRVLILIVVFPTFPFSFWDSYIVASGGPMLNIASIISPFVDILPALAVTVAVSDICLGGTPGVLRSYKRAFSRDVLPLVLTYVALVAVIVLGFFALVVPGIILLTWFLFVTPIMVLERRYGLQAFKRSKKLGDGYHWRDFGIMAVVLLAALSVMIVYEGMMVGFAEPMNVALRAAIDTLFITLFIPLFYVCMVLLYYDLRARKEAYDSTALTEDLLR